MRYAATLLLTVAGFQRFLDLVALLDAPPNAPPGARILTPPAPPPPLVPPPSPPPAEAPVPEEESWEPPPEDAVEPTVTLDAAVTGTAL